MKRLKISTSQLCRRLREQPSPLRLRELACELRETLKKPQKISARAWYFSRRHDIPLHTILLALGYESSLVDMLGQRYGC